MSDTVGWTGSVSGCNAGTTSASSQQLSLSAINFDRALAGLDPITLDSALSLKAQQAALVMSANSALSHDVPSSWKCYTSTAHAAAASSNLYLGEAGAKAIDGYMVDPGTSNSAVGHRRWILYPPTTTMGTGSTSNSNALYVFGKMATAGNYTNPKWVAWPTSGYFPTQLEPNGKWSLSGSVGHTWNFSHATVRVTNSSGTALSVRVYKSQNGYGANTLVWVVSGLKHPTGSTSISYRVTVRGIVVGHQTTSHAYTVRLIKPATS
jgi:hypothetical protein